MRIYPKACSALNQCNAVMHVSAPIYLGRKGTRENPTILSRQKIEQYMSRLPEKSDTLLQTDVQGKDPEVYLPAENNARVGM